MQETRLMHHGIPLVQCHEFALTESRRDVQSPPIVDVVIAQGYDDGDQRVSIVMHGMRLALAVFVLPNETVARRARPTRSLVRTRIRIPRVHHGRYHLVEVGRHDLRQFSSQFFPRRDEFGIDIAKLYAFFALVKFGRIDEHFVGGHSIDGVGIVVPIVVTLEKFEHLFDGGAFHGGGQYGKVGAHIVASGVIKIVDLFYYPGGYILLYAAR
mmetsp:Transcript_35686/g.75138  ORF Transcript_35686/g.75138 Transcript_35686/m.75138 type:complete len:212 (+) Transcript_35686:541-1176(+)